MVKVWYRILLILIMVAILFLSFSDQLPFKQHYLLIGNATMILLVYLLLLSSKRKAPLARRRRVGRKKKNF